jgi:hypothetical protein
VVHQSYLVRLDFLPTESSPFQQHDSNSAAPQIHAVAKRTRYQHYSLKSAPLRVLTSGKWELYITIFWDTEGVMNMRSFTAAGLYDTEDEADLHGIAYGQRIIDGKVPGLSVG